MKKQNYNPLELPNYAPSEAVRYFHIPFSTIERWASGGSNALVQVASTSPTLLSFKNLVEFYVLEGLRVEGLSMWNIRRGVECMMNTEKIAHPLADCEIRTDGKDLWFLRGGIPINASRGGRMAFDAIVTPYLRRVARDVHGVAEKILPYTKKEQLHTKKDIPAIIEIDPRRCFGMPVLLHSRITTAFLVTRHRGGDSVSTIAKSYGRPLAEVKEAIEWELGREIKAA